MISPRNKLDFESLTVIFAARNYMKFIPMLWEELIILRKFNAEVIIIDDDSNDGSYQKLQDLISIYKLHDIKHVNIAHSGPGQARNIGISLASREWITFWDVDDTRNLFEVSRTLSRDENFDLTVSNFKFLDSPSQKVSPNKFSQSGFLLNIAFSGGLWRMYFRRELLRDKEFPITSMGEDLVFISRVLRERPRIKWCDSVTYIYSTGLKDSLTSRRKTRSKSIASLLCFLEDIKSDSIETNSFDSIILLKLLKTSIKNSPSKIFPILIAIYGGSRSVFKINFSFIGRGLKMYFRSCWVENAGAK